MKKAITLTLICVIISLLIACSNSNTSNSLSPQDEARQKVIEKWEKEENVVGTARFIEDTYKKYPNDEVIANIYYYCIAKQEYDLYKQFTYNNDYLKNAEEYAAKIDPNYNGVFSDEMHSFVNSLISSDSREEKHTVATTQEDKYNSLSNADKKKICEYIQERYDYYDKKNGGNAGDKYSDTIMQEAANEYGLSVSQIKIIWMKSYEY